MTQPVLDYAHSPDPAIIARRRRFGLSWWTSIPLLVFIVSQFVLIAPIARYQTQSKDGTIPYMAGHVGGGVLLAAMIAVLAWSFAHRSRLAASITFTVVLGIMGASGYAEAKGYRVKTASAIYSRHLASFHSKRTATESAGRDANKAGTIVDNAGRPGGLEAQLHATDKAVQMMADFLAYADAAPQALDADLAGAGIPAADRAQLLARFANDSAWATGRPVVAASHKVFVKARVPIVYLSDHRGEWSFDSRIGRIQWNTQLGYDQYAAAVHDVEQANQIVADLLKPQGTAR